MKKPQTDQDATKTSEAISFTITAIVPAFNEQGCIGKVLAVLRDVTEFGEIIVVDDGSTDGTLAEAEEAARSDSRIRCLRFPVNQGKGAAMFAGARTTAADGLAFLMPILWG